MRGALFTHIEDRIAPQDMDRNKILITTHPEHVDVWYWTIPFSNGCCSLGVVAEVIIFALSNKLFRRCSARDMLLISAICGVVRWGIMGATTALPWLIVVQILHCGTFTVCHLAAMRYIAARQGSEVIRLQAVYSAVAMGGSIAIMTVFAGFLYQYLGHGVFWVMALVALPAMFLRPKVVPSC